ncbi:MAG TPA: hypothetical protein VHZ51_14180 [Ktedonobacteraceae bacterium]|jgi:hypothetical protein|nr:hypothetical protein [Ktedonobacteraceae bacterium]
MEWLIILALFIVLDIVALRWGKDSRDKSSGAIWERCGNAHSLDGASSHHL